LAVSTGGAGTDRGSGGMSSKLAAARIASWSGVTAVIAAASAENAVLRAVRNDGIGTRFLPHDRNLSARKLWIAFAAEVEGSVVVDDGAVRALRERGTSLLPAGVASVDGVFDAGAVVDIVDGAGVLVARGLAAMSAELTRRNAGKRTADLDDTSVVEVVHRDDLVVL
jgi:glutamate 5-kinase